MRIGTDWCGLVLIGADWCGLVLMSATDLVLSATDLVTDWVRMALRAGAWQAH